MNHIGIYLTNAINKNEIIDSIFSNTLLQNYIDLSQLHGELHSTITIDKIIDEEYRHDKFPVVTNENTSLVSMSSGQQRKALLAYLLNQHPDFILLDDIVSNIDAPTQQTIINDLEDHAATILYIQLFYRKQDILPCIQTVITVDNQGFILSHQPMAQFLKISECEHQIGNITLPDLFDDDHLSIDPLIQLNSVSVDYLERPVLDKISWTIRPGEFWQLKGPVGSGKSTILSMIIGDNPKAYGQDMILFGRKKGSGETIWDIKRHIGYFYPKMTLLFTHNDTVENMLISGLVDSLGLYSEPNDWQRQVARAWMQVLGDSFRNKRFNELSSGQQRILLVVRALVKQPPLLILDEPTAGLDEHNAQLFISLITTIAAQHKIAVIYVSHRSEPNLKPDNIIELIPAANGSTATVTQNK